MDKSILDLLDELRAIAQTGLNYAKDPYDIQRYNRLMQIATKQYSSFTALPSEEIKQRFADDIGYITSKVGVQCALFDNSGKILLEKRADDKLWGLPGGWVDAGEVPEEAIRREIGEEANLLVKDLKMVKVFSRRPGEYHQPHSSVHILYLALDWEGELKKSFESLEMKFCELAEITEWHRDHQRQANEANEIWKHQPDR